MNYNYYHNELDWRR